MSALRNPLPEPSMSSSRAVSPEALEALWKCFPLAEARRLQEILRSAGDLDEPSGSEVQQAFAMALKSLPGVAEAILACPNVLEHQHLGTRERSAESLIDALCIAENSSIEFVMPTGAILGRAFVLAKLNFLKALGYILDQAGPKAEGRAGIVREMIGDTIFSKLAEELLTAAISNPHNHAELKRAAAQRLLSMWNNRLQVPVGEFPPVLLSAWKARLKVRATFGTLMGVNELFSFVQNESESLFVSHFVREHVTTDERDAFQEFLFGLSYEDLERVRSYMREEKIQVISPNQVRELLADRNLACSIGETNPEQIYGSYCRRRLRADYRAMSGVPGPKKTAEGYIMETLLREQR